MKINCHTRVAKDEMIKARAMMASPDGAYQSRYRGQCCSAANVNGVPRYMTPSRKLDRVEISKGVVELPLRSFL